MAVMLTDRKAGDRGGCSCCIKFAVKNGKQKLRRKVRRTERREFQIEVDKLQHVG